MLSCSNFFQPGFVYLCNFLGIALFLVQLVRVAPTNVIAGFCSYCCETLLIVTGSVGYCILDDVVHVLLSSSQCRVMLLEYQTFEVW